MAIGTIAALAGLGGVALNANRGMPPAPAGVVAAAPGHKPIVTRTSGSAAAAQPAAARHSKQAPATPIVTGTSGGRGSGQASFEDD